MYFYVWFYIDGSPNLHKGTVRADGEEEARSLYRLMWAGHFIEIEKVEQV